MYVDQTITVVHAAVSSLRNEFIFRIITKKLFTR